MRMLVTRYDGAVSAACDTASLRTRSLRSSTKSWTRVPDVELGQRVVLLLELLGRLRGAGGELVERLEEVVGQARP